MRSLWPPYTFWAHCVCAFILSMSITRGAMARTRGSTAALSHVVQPRFDAPETTKRSIFCPNSFCANACTVYPRSAHYSWAREKRFPISS